MKKNFFKKLSFVLALAMIVTALAPASGVFAAAKPKLNKSTVYIHVAENPTEFDFNISNKKTGWKYSWKSSNEDVAEVDSKGLVTAVGKGTATISVTIKNAKGEKVTTLKGKVVVRDNIKKLTIKNPVEGDKLAVGQKYDFNRSFVTASGNKKVTSGITRWAVDGTGATIVADSGVFVANEPGTYTITARAFQSKAKYNSWLEDPEKYAKYVTASVTYEVKVAADTVSAKQTTLKKVDLTFDSAVTDEIKNKISLYRVSGSTEILTAIKSVSLDSTKKVATVEAYTNFAEEATYVLKVTDMKDQSFVAATAKITDVTEIKVLTTLAEVNEAREIEVGIYNKDGVNIANSDLNSRLTYESSATNAFFDKSNHKITFYNVGDTSTITVTYHTYDYDTDGTEKGALTATGVVTCVKDLLDENDKILAYTIGTSADWNNVNKVLAVGDDQLYSGTKLFIKLQTDVDGNNSIDDSDYVVSPTGDFEFASSNTGVLMVMSDGTLLPVAVGSAVVMVKYKGSEVGTVVVNVSAKREVATVSLNTTNFALSNATAVADTKDLVATVKDQYGQNMDPSQFSFRLERSNPNLAVNVSGTTSAVSATKDDGVKYTIGGSGATEGAHSYIFTAEDNNSHKLVKGYVTINVQTPSSSAVSYYRVEASSDSVDTKLTRAASLDKSVTLTLFGYAGNNVKVTRENITASPYSVNVTKPNGATLEATYLQANTSAKNIKIDLIPVSGGEIKKFDKGTYQVTVISGAGTSSAKALNTTIFKVTDTQVAPVATVNKLYTEASGTRPDLVVADCIKVTVDGVTVPSTDIIDIVSSYDNNNNLFIFSISVKQEMNSTTGAYIKTKIDINKSFKTSQPGM